VGDKALHLNVFGKESEDTLVGKKIATNQKSVAICLVYPPPAAQAGSIAIRLAEVVQLVECSVEDIYIISSRRTLEESLAGSKVHFIGGNVTCPNAGDSLLSTIFGELRAQMRISRALFSLPRDARPVFWRARSSTIVIPFVLARLRGKKSILLLESRGSELVGQVYKGPLRIGGLVLSGIYKAVERATYSLANRLIVNVPGLLKQPWLAKYGSKVFSLTVTDRFVNPDFKISRPLSQRQTIVGYIGRMSREKGVLNLVEAIPSICNQMDGVRFLLGGDGSLLEQVREELADLISRDQANVPGWIPYSELPGHLNDMRLLVLPSYYEGLPNIILEAMACGTPVLATRVGAVPDIIADGKTGFIMEDNSPECIANNVIRALNHPNLDRISGNARAFVEREYSYEAMKEKWHRLLTSLSAE
jgi:glycosyltransferase involved in cell wall biosynthesis